MGSSNSRGDMEPPHPGPRRLLGKNFTKVAVVIGLCVCVLSVLSSYHDTIVVDVVHGNVTAQETDSTNSPRRQCLISSRGSDGIGECHRLCVSLLRTALTPLLN